MIHHSFWLTASDHSQLYVNQWLPAAPLKAVILLAHGMAEHSGRYARLAEALCNEGYGVYALDLRGHGKTAEHGVLGHFADDDGWCKVVGDLASLNQHIGQQHPGTPDRAAGPQHGQLHRPGLPAAPQRQPVRGHPQRLEFPAGGAVPRRPPDRPLRTLAPGRPGRSALIEWLSFGSFNKAFKPNRTAFDWLSRDPDEVDKYARTRSAAFAAAISCGSTCWAACSKSARPQPGPDRSGPAIADTGRRM